MPMTDGDGCNCTTDNDDVCGCCGKYASNVDSFLALNNKSSHYYRNQVRRYSVVFGMHKTSVSSDRFIAAASDIIVHNRYSTRTMANDIAIIGRPVELGELVYLVSQSGFLLQPRS